jgi:hypothetical protein
MNYEELQRRFELLKKIIQPTGKFPSALNLEPIEKMIKEDIPRTFEHNPPTDFQKLYAEFVGEYERFHDFILFDKLIGKNVVALGGGFKSGKSTFLNHFILGGDKILPTGIDPSTSVPAYIIQKNEKMIFGINVFDAKIALELQDIKLISHKFCEPDEENMGKLSLAHLLKSIFIAVPNQRYANIAFMDTPGYSMEDSEHYTEKTKEQSEYLHLNSSNYILWFVPAELGTISNEDIEILRKLRKSIPLLIVLNKADKRKDEIPAIKDKIRSVLDGKGVQYDDILAFSSRTPMEYDSQKIQGYLNLWNKRIYESNFAKNFKVLFVKCKDYYEKMGDLENKKLKLIRDVIAYTQDEKMKERLTILKKVSLANLKLVDEMEIRLNKLQDDFFGELHLVAGKVGIKMPVPSEIALLQEKIKDPFIILSEYKEKHHINSKTEKTVSILENAFQNLNSIFNKQMGGSEYLDVLVETMENNLTFEKEIHFNNMISD